ncbi:MAG: uroporphyrinogen decarboxylase [Myxococcota bacterium]
MSLFLDAARGVDTPRAPIWLMRQAGRYMPEYRALKEKYTFWQLCQNPELAAEVTLQPIDFLGVDAAILFSDIMTPLSSMGAEIDFKPGPVIANPVRSQAAVDALRVPETEAIAPFVGETIAILRGELKVPLIGFGGAPLTLATYLVEGSGSKDYPLFRQFLYAEEAAAHALLGKLAEVSIRYLRMQVEAGAQAIQLFDSWAGLYDLERYRTFGAAYARQVFEGLADLDVPRIYIAVGASHLLEAIAELPVDVVSADWRLPLSQVRARLPEGMALQGNLDPAALLAPKTQIQARARHVLVEGLGGAHIFNLGHGIMRQSPPDHVKCLVDTVQAFDRRAHAVEGS